MIDYVKSLPARFHLSAIIMYDSTDAYAIPSDAQLVAGYVDGYVSAPAMIQRFGAKKVVTISVENNDAMVADVEPGAMQPSDLPGWVDRQVARGIKRPVVYSDGSEYPECVDYVGDRVDYWTADPVGYPITLSGRAAVQYEWTSAYDLSWVLPSFPFYPGASPKPKPVKPVEPELRKGNAGPAVALMQRDLNRHQLVVKPLVTVDGVFGPKTESAVKEWQRFKKITVDGICGPQTWATLLVNPGSF
jgi:hypothetical protein